LPLGIFLNPDILELSKCHFSGFKELTTTQFFQALGQQILGMFSRIGFLNLLPLLPTLICLRILIPGQG
jgi:hypothetical protein